jgi:hypothetical protein
MVMRTRFLFLLAALTACAAPLAAQLRPVAGFPIDIMYRLEAASPLAGAEHIDLVYAVNFWGTRYGTRLALLENVLRPDSGRAHRVPMTRSSDGWKATIELDTNAAVFSYYFTDGKRRDDNGEKTYVAYVYGADGKPVRNAHFYMTSFLDLARKDLDTRLKEAEEETIRWPENFRAYTLYFTLLFERDKGRDKCRKQILEQLENLKQKYWQNEEYMNLAARTFYYLLHDEETAMQIKKDIPVNRLWPDVFMIYDREAKAEERRRLELERSQRRSAILNTELPASTYYDTAMVKQPLRQPNTALLLIFWASSSEQSVAALVRLNALRARYASKQVKLIAINLDSDERAGRQKITSLALPVEHGFRIGTMLADLGIDGIPTVLFVDTQGMVRKVSAGFGSADESEIEAALGALP